MVRRRWTAVFLALLAVGIAASVLYPAAGPWIHAASVQSGLLDPIPLAHRAVNLTVMPIFRTDLAGAATEPRHYAQAWTVGLLFWAPLLGCLWIPRFYCRVICPLGALFGFIGARPLWRIGKRDVKCRSCLRCESRCEGACSPSAAIRTCECVLCMNCMDRCSTGNIGYRTRPSAAGEVDSVDLSRRAFSASLVSGLAVVPMVRLTGSVAGNWPPLRVRPPGALDEDRFLRRCIKCGQCMRVCPTNVIQPAGWQAGVEGLWTPVLNFRIGASGCQLNCVACGHVCPTSAIRPLALDEKLGRGKWAGQGPVRIGTAFVDHGRCLPWAMGRPCIVCQENCPVSPKAIRVTEDIQPVPGGPFTVRRADGSVIEADFSRAAQDGRPYASGDYVLLREGDPPRRIVGLDAGRVTIAPEDSPEPAPALENGDRVSIAVRLQRPNVDPGRCIGCGVCEHECPVQGLRAIRVTAENESRAPEHALIAGRI
jgi:ferredoxin